MNSQSVNLTVYLFIHLSIDPSIYQYGIITYPFQLRLAMNFWLINKQARDEEIFI